MFISRIPAVEKVLINLFYQSKSHLSTKYHSLGMLILNGKILKNLVVRFSIWSSLIVATDKGCTPETG